MKRRWLLWGAFSLLAVAAGLGWWWGGGPRCDRDWIPGQEIMPRLEFQGEQVVIRGVRDYRWRTTADFEPHYRERRLDLGSLAGVDLGFEPFPSGVGAHTFLSFRFADGEPLVVSVEARKEKGETFSVVRGLLNAYELMYVLATEEDEIQLRANARGDTIYLYPVRAPLEAVRKMLLLVLERAEKLATEPEFYHTLFNNCTVNLIRHVNTVAPGRIRYNWRTLDNGLIDREVYELGLIDTELPWERVRERFRVNERSRRYAGSPDFSARIRGTD